MKLRSPFKVGRMLLALIVAVAVASLPVRGAAHRAHADASRPAALCSASGTPCTEVYDSEAVFGEGSYVGHDEPSALFYSNTPGSGNSTLYRMTLPADPKQKPRQDGTGGTFNFQLHPTFWFGMAMCDTQSAPEFTHDPASCPADSDSNIFDNPNPAAADYLGRHPGTAFMEMQFYPPALNPRPFGVTCDVTKWCAAMTIDSLSQDLNTSNPKAVNNNADCLNKVGPEPVNLALITKNGVAQSAADPLNTDPAQVTQGPQTLLMNSGDKLSVDIHDSAAGVQVVIRDLSSGQSGSMTASIANGFAQVNFRPNDTTCSSTPYAFHPMYSTSSEHTRVVWAAHSYNVAFSDEIGHFEYCSAASNKFPFPCTGSSATDPSGLDSDDLLCFNPGTSPVVSIGGCQNQDLDFDGPEYANTWPGTGTNNGQDQKFHADPVIFTSPLANGTTNFQRAAFETDLPRIEFATNPPCQRHVSNPADPHPGQGCVNPPVGASFYPFFTTGGDGKSCVWQLGGADIKGTTNTFGGNSAVEYGGLLLLNYPAAGNTVTQRFNDFRQVLSSNPCPANSGE